MPKVEIYTKMFCPYCVRAKRLLADKGVDFEEIDITMGGPRRAEMIQRANGRTTVPQIFIGDAHVAGPTISLRSSAVASYPQCLRADARGDLPGQYRHRSAIGRAFPGRGGRAREGGGG